MNRYVSAIRFAARLGLCVLLAASTPLFASQPRDDDESPAARQARRLLIRGLTQAQIGNYDEAVALYEEALEHVSDDPALLSAAAEAHEAREDLGAALFYAEQAATLTADRPHYGRQLARLQRQAGQPRQALQTYAQLLDRFPEDVPALEEQAELLAVEGEAEAALTSYRKLLQLTGEQPDVRRKMLPLLRKTGNVQGLEETLQSLTLLEPGTTTHHRELVELYLQQNRPQAARRIIEQVPDRTRSDQLAALLDSETSSGEESAASFSPEGASISELIEQASRLYERPDRTDPQTDETIDLLERALEIDPDHFDALALLGRLRYEQHAFEEAADRLTQALNLDPRHPVLWSLAAEALRQDGRLDEARATAEEGLLLFPGRLPLLRSAAETALSRGEPAEALRYVEEALTVLREESTPDRGNHADVLVLKGRALAADGRQDAAQSAWREALEHDPDNETARRHLDAR